ncbi:hypothetical protein AB4Z54_51450, partial [Streptomyces sp. MCAF7]
MTGFLRLRDIEARHPALQGAKSSMQTNSDKSPTGVRFPSALVGATVGIGGVGAALTLAGIDSPLRAPFTLLFLITAPASA